GVVTSETGAVIHDIIDITRRRNKMIDIVLYPAKVQGVGAEDTIVSGIKALDKTNVDVIVVARGGGSLEDLSCFNTEKVAVAIFEAQKPVVSAVGHETDFTIADFVADVRAPTPSAAAELLSSDISTISGDFYSLVQRLNRFVDNYFADIYNNLDTYSMLIQKSANAKVSVTGNALYALVAKFVRLSTEKFNNIFADFDILTTKLDALNPIQIMKRGYSQAIKDNKTITSASQVQIGDEIEINLYKGKLQCQVKSKTEK
ncbi:MAG: exodeoxyribonuclease VII large subunit, partial [Clostridia bacterium]|nr:exodeoxyribonuclease VII large subunit [Clostridia bacterium]